jgi:hypothetical protein
MQVMTCQCVSCVAYSSYNTKVIVMVATCDKIVVFLDNQRLKESVNYKQMKDGFACPLYCDTLFASSRDEFNNALAHAKQNNLGYWPTDSTEAGVIVNTHADPATIKPIWPKIWRRLDEYPGNQNSLNGFIDWLGDRNEWVDILSIMGERAFKTS